MQPSDQRKWWRGRDLNPRPSGYEPDELPNCSTPRRSGPPILRPELPIHNRGQVARSVAERPSADWPWIT